MEITSDENYDIIESSMNCKMGSDIVKYIKFKRLQSAGHVDRMDKSRMPKYWMENSMAGDLWKECDRAGKATTGGTPCCC